MRTIISNNVRRLMVMVCFAMFSTQAMSQTYPQMWSMSEYRSNQGVRGHFYLINSNGTQTPYPNKAYIVAATVQSPTDKSKYDSDLFRLTLEGVTTFNSPFPGYNVRLNFYSQTNTYHGTLYGEGNALRLLGNTYLSLGVGNAPALMTMSSGNTIFANNIVYHKNNKQLLFGENASNSSFLFMGATTPTDIMIGTSSLPSMIIDGSLRTVYVGVSAAEFQSFKSGKNRANFTLFIKKGVLSEDYSIAPIASWADYVFDSNYNLKSLNEVESYIAENKHLPDVPSAQEVAENGYSQHEINKALLQKVEELTLYVLQQQKEIEMLKKSLEDKANE